ncbi:hypothetical protein HVMH_0558 [Hydrogenovibrio marinus]|nr:hypothetical protein HVMH_0558 [Hydrogenovibrio marinus]
MMFVGNRCSKSYGQNLSIGQSFTLEMPELMKTTQQPIIVKFIQNGYFYDRDGGFPRVTTKFAG